MVSDHLKTEQLAKQVRARKEFLNRVVKSLMNLVQEYGIVTKRDTANCHIRVVSELRNFRSFTFATDLGQTDFGGNTTKVWYHPGKNFREGGLDSAWDKEWTPVLDVDFQVTGDDYEVHIFNESVDWQRALLHVFKNKIKIAAQIERNQKETLKKVKKWKQVDTKMDKLVADARKLRIIP